MSPTPFSPERLVEITSPQQLHLMLRQYGCASCELGQQPDFRGPVVYRGNPSSRRMIIGEAPGLKEDINGEPFVGPAGQLLDQYLLSVNWETNRDFFITNCVLCRPVAPLGSGKENLTPKSSHRTACAPYLNWMINTIKPKLIVLIGGVATKAVLQLPSSTRVGDYVGRVLQLPSNPETIVFVIFHPAAQLHSQGQTEKEAFYKKAIQEQVEMLRRIDNDL